MLIFISATGAYEKAYILFPTKNDFLLNIFPLKRVPYIFQPVYFEKKQANIQAFLNSDSKLNTMIPAYIAQLGFKIKITNIRIQKIDDSIFKTFKIVLASLQIKNKLKKNFFFSKTFLLTAINVYVILKLFFLTFGNVKIIFVN